MIASVRGVVSSMGAGSAVIEVSGVGILVQATPETLSRLRTGEEALLFTSLVVREDSLTLFGFSDDDERAVFDILQSVSGIGPRTALAILSVHNPDQLRHAVALKDEGALTRVPGIGKKGAARMILELGTKLGPAKGSTTATQATDVAADVNAEVLTGLVNLGWTERDAAPALAQAQSDIPNGTVAQLLRASLQILGSRR